MKYSTHKIKPTGHIEVREETETGQFHRFVIDPNEPLSKYNEQIESDPDFKKYRTKENADAHEAKLKELEPTQEEIDEREEKRQLQQQREQVKQELKESRPPQSNPELAKRVEKLEFTLGIREDYTE